MSNDALLQAGLSAARAGDLEEAAKYFAQLVKEEPTSEQGWMGLGFCCSDKKQREYCFQRVLAINPGNAQARQALELQESPVPAATRVARTQPPSIVTTGPSTLTYKPEQAISTSLSKDQPVVEKDKPVSMQTAQPKAIIQEPVPENKPKKKPKKKPAKPVFGSPEPVPEGNELFRIFPGRKRKIKPLTVVLLLAILPLLVCVAGIAYLFLSGKTAQWLPGNPFPILPRMQVPATVATATRMQSPTPVATSTSTQPPTLAATATLTPTPSATPTPTPAPTLEPTLKPTLAYTPIFTKGTCEFAPPDGVVVTCGYVTVPEDRTDSRSKTIQLAVIVFHSTSSDPAPDPVVFLQGGPGGAAVLMSAENYDVLVKPFLSNRDYIAFDQRGTGISKPALGCDELEKVYKQDMGGQIPASSRNYIYTNAFRSCHGAMTIGGIHLNSYTTLASSDDLKDIVTALGYHQVNLYSASYGTRLALVTMRDHPEIVRSAVLDSVVPVEVKLFDEDPIRYDSSLQAMFEGCAADLACNTAYPDLKTVFWNLVDQLDTKPVAVTAPLPVGNNTQNVDGGGLIGMTLGLLKTTKMIAYAPETIYKIKDGDYSTFVSMQASLPYEFTGINIGLYISMMCHEHVLATTSQDLQAAMDAHHDLGKSFRLPFFGDAKTMFNTCKVWGAVPPAAGENAAVLSDIPALIIEGKYDPATPPIFGKQVAANLSNSYYMEFPNQGHTPTATDTSGCAFGTLLAFFNNPEQKPDMTCLSAIKGVDFIVP